MQYQCPHCSKFFSQEIEFLHHMRVHTGEKPYQCSICSESFTWESQLTLHMRVHTGKYPQNCSKCDQCFISNKGLSGHMASHTTHTMPKRLECYLCHKFFSSKQYLECHMMVHNGKKPHQCSECGKRFRWEAELVVHKKVHPVYLFCSKCGQCFSSQQSLSVHMAAHTQEKQLQCLKCSKFFGSRAELRSHMKVHEGEKPFHCYECKESFTKQDDLAQHTKTHLEASRYQCSHCRVVFGQENLLSWHLKLHAKEPPYQCAKCANSYNYKLEYLIHMTELHMEEEPLYCLVCNECVARKSELCTHIIMQHMKPHPKQSQIQCLDCGITFSQEKLLLWHLKLHTDEGVYQCSECTDASYSRKYDYLIHMTACHMKERPFRCVECNRAFKHMGTICNHIQVHHKETYVHKPKYPCSEDRISCGETSILLRLLQGHSGRDPNHSPKSNMPYLSKSKDLTHMPDLSMTHKPYHCIICGIAFADKFQLRNHYKVHTKRSTSSKTECPESKTNINQEAEDDAMKTLSVIETIYCWEEQMCVISGSGVTNISDAEDPLRLDVKFELPTDDIKLELPIKTEETVEEFEAVKHEI